MSEVARLQPRAADPQADLSLPGWIYHDPEFFAVEMERLIREGVIAVDGVKAGC